MHLFLFPEQERYKTKTLLLKTAEVFKLICEMFLVIGSAMVLPDALARTGEVIVRKFYSEVEIQSCHIVVGDKGTKFIEIGRARV